MSESITEEVDKGFEANQGKDVLSWCRIPTDQRSLADLQAGVKDLRRWEVFRTVSDKFLLTLAGTVHARHLKDGQVLFRQNQKTDRACFFVWAGAVSLFVDKKAREFPENGGADHALDSNVLETQTSAPPSLESSFHAKLLPSHARNTVFIGVYEEEKLPAIQRVENHGHLVAVKPPGKLLGKQSALTSHRRYATAVAASNTYILEIPGHCFYDLLAIAEEKFFAEDSVFLRETPCFKWLDDDTLFAAAACFHRQHFVAKAEVCLQGSHSGRMYLVREGKCEVLRHVRQERERGTGPKETTVKTIHVSDLSQRDLYGHWELLEDKPSLFSVKAKCATEIWTLTMDDLNTIRKVGDSEMIIRELREDGEISMNFHRHRTRHVGSIRWGQHQRQLNSKHRPAVQEIGCLERTSPGGRSARIGKKVLTHVTVVDPASALERASSMANRGLHRRIYSRTINPSAVGVRGPREMKPRGILVDMDPVSLERSSSPTEEWLEDVGYAAKESRHSCSRIPGREHKVQRRLLYITQLLHHAAAVAHGDTAPEPQETDTNVPTLKNNPSHLTEWINLTTFLAVLHKAGLTVKSGGELGISVGEQLPENQATIVFLAAARALRNRMHPPGCIPLPACIMCLRNLCNWLACPLPQCLMTKEETHAQQRPRDRHPQASIEPQPSWESPFLKRRELQKLETQRRDFSPIDVSESSRSRQSLPHVQSPSRPLRQLSPRHRIFKPRQAAQTDKQYFIPQSVSGVSFTRVDLSVAASLPATPNQASPFLDARRKARRSTELPAGGRKESPETALPFSPWP